MSMESSFQALSIDMAVGGPILKISENMAWFRYTFIPERVQVFPKQERFLTVYAVETEE